MEGERPREPLRYARRVALCEGKRLSRTTTLQLCSETLVLSKTTLKLVPF